MKQQHGSLRPPVVWTCQNPLLLLQQFNSTQCTTAMQTDIFLCVTCVCINAVFFYGSEFLCPSEQTLFLLKWSWDHEHTVCLNLMSFVCLWCRNRGVNLRMSVTQFQESEPWRASVSRNRSALSLTTLPLWNWRASRSNMAASAAPVTEPTMQLVWR